MDYRAAIAGYVRQQAAPVDKFSHQPRLYALAVAVGDGLAYDDDVLYAAAWLHDLGVFIGHRPEDPAELARWDNVAYAVASVPAILGRLGFPAARVAAVQSAIQHHLPAAAPPTIEGAILRDADILEQLGAVGILRTVSKVGRDTRFHTFGDALAALERNLASLPGQLRLPAARRLAQARIAALAAFLAAARAEGAE